jgi:hypothetical protein
MMEVPLSDAQLAALAREVDEQLKALRDESPEHSLSRGPKDAEEPPAAPKQRAAIEQATGEKFESFWQRYLRQARRDLCLPGGVLHDQWKKWRDLESKAAVRVSYGWLAAIGIQAASIPIVVVPAAVFLINAALKIGIDAICEGCAEEEKARAKELKAAAEAASKEKKNPKAP